MKLLITGRGARSKTELHKTQKKLYKEESKRNLGFSAGIQFSEGLHKSREQEKLGHIHRNHPVDKIDPDRQVL